MTRAKTACALQAWLSQAADPSQALQGDTRLRMESGTLTDTQEACAKALEWLHHNEGDSASAASLPSLALPLLP